MDLQSEVTIEDVLRSALGLEIGRCGQLEMNRVARSLKLIGCHRIKTRSGTKRFGNTASQRRTRKKAGTSPSLEWDLTAKVLV